MSGVSRARCLHALAVLGVLAVDQATKAWAAVRLTGNAPVELVPGLFRLVMVHNRGALFGMFQDLPDPVRSLLFLALPTGVIAVLGWLSWRTSPLERRAHAAFALLLGGALGNLADRLRLGHVIDFLDVYITGTTGNSYHWPAFNVADACICTGIGLLALDSLRSGRAAEISPEAHRAPDPV